MEHDSICAPARIHTYISSEKRTHRDKSPPTSFFLPAPLRAIALFVTSVVVLQALTRACRKQTARTVAIDSA
eukprot:1097702-Pleurochrysis_carterae.AAC.25